MLRQSFALPTVPSNSLTGYTRASKHCATTTICQIAGRVPFSNEIQKCLKIDSRCQTLYVMFSVLQLFWFPGLIRLFAPATLTFHLGR